MSRGYPNKRKRKRVERALYRGAGGCDEPVTVVCSRYERRRKPVSLIRTCQELVDENSFEKEVVEIVGEVDRVGFGII